MKKKLQLEQLINLKRNNYCFVFFNKKLKFFKSLNENIICVDVYDTDNITDYIKFDMRNSVEIVLNYIFKLNHKKIGLLVGRNKVVKNLVDFREKYFKEIMVKNGYTLKIKRFFIYI